jgi:DNA-binding CsgD family transcriptional regulator/PAS domain-containing protein
MAIPQGDHGNEHDRYAAAVDAVYETAIAPDKWPMALQTLAEVFGDVGATLNYQRSDGRFGAIVSPALLAGQDDYNREWYRHDVRIERYLQRRYLAADTITDRELGLVEAHETHPFFTEFLKGCGLRWFASVSIAPDADVFAVMSVHRSLEREDFTADERAMLLRLGKHAEKSLRLGLRLMESESRSLGLTDLLDRLSMGVFLLDAVGRVVFANETAQGFLGDGLLLESDRLTARDQADRPAFQVALSAAVRPEIDDAFSLRPVMLQRGGAGAPLAAYILPLRTRLSPALEHFLVRSQFIVLVIEVKSGAPADPALVRDLLGLTLGEARVAALIATGMTPREVSQRLDITEGTTRTVLKRVFHKAGVSRQSELAALLARAVVDLRQV